MLITLEELRRTHLPAYGEKRIREWARDGVIPAVRCGRKWMFDARAVVAALTAFGNGARSTVAS